MKMTTNLVVELTDKERCIIGDFRRFLHLEMQEVREDFPELAHKLDCIDTKLYWLQKGILEKS